MENDKLKDGFSQVLDDLKNGIDNKATRAFKKLMHMDGLETIKINGKIVYDKKVESK